MRMLSTLEAAALATLIAFDQAIATPIFADLEDVTISAHVGVVQILVARGDIETLQGLGIGAEETRICLAMASALDDLQAGHCQSAIDGDIARAKAAQAFLAPYATVA